MVKESVADSGIGLSALVRLLMLVITIRKEQLLVGRGQPAMLRTWRSLGWESDTAWNEAYIMLVSCIDYALDMTCIQSVSQCFIVCGIL